MSEPVTAIYTAEVHTVTPETSLEEVMRVMTERRIRHAPVVVDGVLRGIVSIGDVVKSLWGAETRFQGADMRFLVLA